MSTCFDTTRVRSKLSRQNLLATAILEPEIDRDVFQDLLMGDSRVTSVAQRLWAKIVRPGDTVVDGTIGNGYDTAYLTKLVTEDGKVGRVVGFEVQEMAIRTTKHKLEDDPELSPAQVSSVELHHACHSKIGEFVGPMEARLVCFNLGYLPGGDKDIMTLAPTTLAALQAATEATMPGGLVNIIAYIRHEGGQDEYDTVLGFVRGLDSRRWNVVMGDVLNRDRSPVLICCYRRTE